MRLFGRNDQFTASFLSMLSYLFFGFWKTISLCRKNKYVFLNTHFVLPTGPLGFLISLIFRIPNILSLHGGDVYDPSKKSSPHRNYILRKIVRFLLNRASHIVAQSSATKKMTEKFYFPNKEIQVIFLPYDPFYFSPKTKNNLSLNQEDFYIVFMGRLIERKGVNTLLDAVSLLPKPIKLLVVGDGPLRSKLSQQVRILNIKDRVRFLGFCSGEEKFQFLAVADIFILSSTYEPFGIVLQEAMQVGLPIVATDKGGHIDFLQDGKNALLVQPQKPQKLADAIEKLYNDQLLRQKMGTQNRQDIQKFSTDSIAQKYLELLSN